MPNGNFQIRPARAADLPHLPAIEAEAAQRFVEAGLFNATDVTGTLPVAFLEQCRVFVADVEDAPVGFAATQDIDEFCHLHEIDVLTAYGGQGVGRALMAAVIDDARARGKLAVTLSTFRDVAWNGPFYARLGFEAVSPVALGAPYAAFRQKEVEAGLDISARDLMMLAF